MKTCQYYKFTTTDGRAFYLLSAERARISATKCGGTYHGPVALDEVRAIYASAMSEAK